MEHPTSQEHTIAQPDNATERSDILSTQQIRDLLDSDSITDLRLAQKEAYDQEYSLSRDEHYSDRLSDKFAGVAVRSTIEDYLLSHGLTFNTPIFNQYSDALMNLSIVHIPEANWKVNSNRDDNGERLPSGREILHTTYEDLTGLGYYEPVPQSADAPDESYEAETAAALEAEKAKLDTLRETLATLSAKRQGRIFGDGGEQYEQALQAYNEQVVAFGKLSKKAIIEDESRDQGDKNKEIITYLFEEQNKLREASLDKLSKTKVSTMIKSFSDFMNRGSKKMRLLKNIGVGVAIGATAGLAGGLGVGAAVAAGVAGISMKWAKAYAVSDASRGRGIEQLQDTEKTAIVDHVESDQAETSDTTHDDLFNQLQTAFNESFEEDVQKEQSKRRKAAIRAVGIVAAGAVLGSFGHALLTGGDIIGFGGGNDTHATSGENPTGGPGGESDGTGGAPATPLEGDTNGDGVVDALDKPTVTADLASESPAMNAEVAPDPDFVIESGEGGIHFFQDLGLTEQQWYDIDGQLLEKFGPNGTGDFYSMGNGNVGLAHPGQLSLEAQQYIKNQFGLAA